MVISVCYLQWWPCQLKWISSSKSSPAAWLNETCGHVTGSGNSTFLRTCFNAIEMNRRVSGQSHSMPIEINQHRVRLDGMALIMLPRRRWNVSTGFNRRRAFEYLKSMETNDAGSCPQRGWNEPHWHRVETLKEWPYYQMGSILLFSTSSSSPSPSSSSSSLLLS